MFIPNSLKEVTRNIAYKGVFKQKNGFFPRVLMREASKYFEQKMNA